MYLRSLVASAAFLAGARARDVTSTAVFLWTPLRHTSSSSSYPVALATTTGLESHNLAILPGELMPGVTYTFRLQVTLADGGTGTSGIRFTVNIPPANGTVASVPAVGMAIRDQFEVTAYSWADEDLPLMYRFSASNSAAASCRNCDRNASSSYLTDFSQPPTFHTSHSTHAILPAGSAAAGFNVTVAVEVRDDLGAVTVASVPVTVHPFNASGGTSISSIASEIISEAAASGDMDVVGQLIGSLAASLNDASEDASSVEAEEDATAAREVLIDAVVGMGSGRMTEAAAERVSQMMSAVTANPAQLSSNSTDKALDLALTMTSGDSIGAGVMSSLADVTSNILEASVQQAAAPEHSADDAVAGETPTIAFSCRCTVHLCFHRSIGLMRDCGWSQLQRRSGRLQRDRWWCWTWWTSLAARWPQTRSSGSPSRAWSHGASG